MSEPHTSREYAYIAISGPGKHEAITKCLGIKPSEAGNRGDINPSSGRPYRHMVWRLRSGLDDTHPLAEHISSLLLVVGTKAHELRELWLDYDIGLQCVGHYPHDQGGGLNLDRELIRRAAQLGLEIDFDCYFFECREDA